LLTIQLNRFLTQVKQSQYLDESSSQDETNLLKQKIRLLDELLNNKHPISPYEGKVINPVLESIRGHSSNT
jgi:hypothetical protein